MKVKNLIKLLSQVRDQEKHIYFYDQDHEIQGIEEIDELSDRVDLNCMKYLPIEKEVIENALQDCEEWGYGSSDTCDLVADRITDSLIEKNIPIEVLMNYRSHFNSLAHNMNCNRGFYKIELEEDDE